MKYGKKIINAELVNFIKFTPIYLILVGNISGIQINNDKKTNMFKDLETF